MTGAWSGTWVGRLGIGLAIVLAGGAAWAEETTLKVITLRHRPAADLVLVLRPLAGPEGAVEVLDSRLVVRATPAALLRIEQAIRELDRELRSLLVTVRQELARGTERSGAGGGGAVSGGGTTVVVSPPEGGTASVETRTSRTVVRGAYGTQSRTEEGGTLQQVRTLEGSPALIRMGRSQPVPAAGVVSTPTGPALVTGTAFVESGVGFYVRPRLAGDTVTLELWVENTTGSAYGEVEGQTLRTTVAGRLGEWIEVGAALREAETRARTLLGGARETSYESRSVSLRVEEVR